MLLENPDTQPDAQLDAQAGTLARRLRKLAATRKKGDATISTAMIIVITVAAVAVVGGIVFLVLNTIGDSVENSVDDGFAYYDPTGDNCNTVGRDVVASVRGNAATTSGVTSAMLNRALTEEGTRLDLNDNGVQDGGMFNAIAHVTTGAPAANQINVTASYTTAPTGASAFAGVRILKGVDGTRSCWTLSIP